MVEALVDDAGMARLEQLVAMVVDENGRQNLIARSTVEAIWNRHVLDSVQLLRWGATNNGTWLDIGTGGGFPGLAIAAVSTDRRFVLVEPRRRRAEFLGEAADRLNLSHVEIRQDKVESIAFPAAVISARAVASIDKLFAAAIRCATHQTCWLMPRGAGYDDDVQHARANWTGVFHVEQSVSDPAARIVMATKVARR